MIKSKSTLKVSKVINIIALIFLIGGAYGIIFTGALQILAAIIFTLAFPKNQLIYIYFFIVLLFFLTWGGNIFGWQFFIPACLIFFLTYIIHFQNKINCNI